MPIDSYRINPMQYTCTGHISNDHNKRKESPSALLSETRNMALLNDLNKALRIVQRISVITGYSGIPISHFSFFT
jgi:hypothetical protein